jgi:hypothetical protein
MAVAYELRAFCIRASSRAAEPALSLPKGEAIKEPHARRLDRFPSTPPLGGAQDKLAAHALLAMTLD